MKMILFRGAWAEFELPDVTQLSCDGETYRVTWAGGSIRSGFPVGIYSILICHA